MIDYYSNFFEIEPVTSPNTGNIIRLLKSQFARHGIPNVIVSDCGPQFTSE